jgi:hypothetical protein
MPPAGQPGGREIYVEFLQQGGFIKATAIDPVTGIEASIVGPAGAAREALSAAAIRKLQFVLSRKSGGG